MSPSLFSNQTLFLSPLCCQKEALWIVFNLLRHLTTWLPGSRLLDPPTPLRKRSLTSSQFHLESGKKPGWLRRPYKDMKCVKLQTQMGSGKGRLRESGYMKTNGNFSQKHEENWRLIKSVWVSKQEVCNQGGSWVGVFARLSVIRGGKAETRWEARAGWYFVWIRRLLYVRSWEERHGIL